MPNKCNWKPPSLSELTTTVSNMELTQLGSKNFNYIKIS